MALPDDLLEDILEQLSNDYYDIASLATTCQRMWSIGYDRVRRVATFNLLNSWAYGRLICVGDYCHKEDLPPTLQQTKGEWIPKLFGSKCAFNKTEVHHYPVPTAEAGKELCLPDTLCQLAADVVPDHSSWERMCGADYSDDGYPLHSSFKRPLHVIDGKEGRALAAITHREGFDPDTMQFSRGYYSEENFVLRNLSKLEYVRGAALANCGKRWPNELNFGRVLLMRVSWSSDSSVAMIDPTKNMHRGPWAGDRFDVVKVENMHIIPDHVAGVSDGPWRDVSEDLLCEVHAIIEANNDDSDD